ncbi:hypothetical protein [Endobacterium cereale]|uniref:hypothetical protein n=1 Tax=Endobacterium cereale TaxID=2663029 RepID=UPI002B48A692|nr:hypothetical protein [Endobacterium cereale]MEB2846803.1 hypothetical protein [Endobacterium cereale]
MKSEKFLKSIQLDWGTIEGGDTAYAETDKFSLWIERTQNPDEERWLWTIDKMVPGLPLEKLGIAATKIQAIIAAENALPTT